jgi:hypothetical protein
VSRFNVEVQSRRSRKRFLTSEDPAHKPIDVHVAALMMLKVLLELKGLPAALELTLEHPIGEL